MSESCKWKPPARPPKAGKSLAGSCTIQVFMLFVFVPVFAGFFYFFCDKEDHPGNLTGFRIPELSAFEARFHA